MCVKREKEGKRADFCQDLLWMQDKSKTAHKSKKPNQPLNVGIKLIEPPVGVK